jgi:superfamily II DNA or RNA helicase
VSTLFDLSAPPQSRAMIVPRHYQREGHDSTFRLWDSGVRGVLSRVFTGGGKTVQSALMIDTWLGRSDNHRAMVISYETQLVNQFSEELYDCLGISAKIEMGQQQSIDAGSPMPQIIVASRASLLRATPPTEDQIAALRDYGINDAGCVPQRKFKPLLQALAKGADPLAVRDEIDRLNREPEARNGFWSRVHKFDPSYDWLLVFDEAHKHAYHLKSVGHVIDWFGQNPNSRWTGMTATPKRGDGVSLGDRMFPGIAIDYPLYKPGQPCGVSDGWAVPYVQRYIEVEGVDFKSLNKIAGDFDEAELERLLGAEEQLARLVEPLLDMVADRRTLVFSPGVEMAKSVARYINARSRVVCACGYLKWHPTLLIGDGAKCPQCGRLAEDGDVDRRPDQARELDGSTPHTDRRQVYSDHQAGKFQFLSVCGLCREGYNDPDVACVAVFRPVSKKASALAEQMKGRACRPLRSLLNALGSENQKAERLAAIASSAKPNALIVDLVGITGLADCASTVEIYAEGLPDRIKQRAEDILAEAGLAGTAGVEEAIEQAKREDAEARERARLEREAAERHAKELYERRAKAQPQVEYTTHEAGIGAAVDPKAATEKQLKMMAFLGLDVWNTVLTKKQAGRIIDQLQRRLPLSEIVRTNGLDPECCAPRGPSKKQQWALAGLPCQWVASSYDASLVIGAMKNPAEVLERLAADITGAADGEQLNTIGRLVRDVNNTVRLPQAVYSQLIERGRRKRAELQSEEPF